MNIKHDSRGVAHLAAILIVAGVLAIVGFAAFRVVGKNKNDGTSNSSAVSAEMKQLEKECNNQLKDEDFCKFASRFSLETDYKAVITATADGRTSVSEMEVDSKGNSLMVVKENGKETSSFISLDNVSYFKDLDSGTWYRLAGTDDSSTSSDEDYKEDIKVDIKNLKDDKTTYKKIATEKCNNLKCFKYQVIDPENPGLEQFLWFDDKNYQLRRWATKEGGNTSDMTIEYTAVNIKAPSPVKDYSTQSSDDIDAAIRAAQEAMTASEE